MSALSRSVAAWLAIAAVAVFAAPASADTVQIGSALGHAAAAPNGELCTNCVGVQRSQAGGNSPLPLSSPANGTVTTWAVRTGDIGAVYNLRVLRPLGSSAYTGEGTSPAVTVPAGTTDSVLNNGVSLPIKQGDAIGVAVSPGHGLPSWPDNVNADVVGYTPPFADGASSGNTTDIPGHELLIQATVRFCNVPSLKRLKTKPAKRALRAHDCLPKVKRSRVKKNKFRGRVLKQKVAAGTTATPGTIVPIVIGKKK
jgi:hypothetical protein